MREISILKQRILEYLEKKGISKYECYKNTGITNGVLSQSNGMSEDNLLKFLSYYSEINPIWLLTGQGEMLSVHQGSSGSKNSPTNENTMLLQEKNARIAALEKIISSQDRTIELLEEKIAVLSAPLVVPVVDTAAAG